MADLDDLTLDELRRELAPGIAAAAAFDGWSPAAVASVAAEAGVDPDAAAYAFSGGAMEMILATVALEHGLIDERIFVALVVMALVTSLISGPALRRLLRKKAAGDTAEKPMLEPTSSTFKG